MGGILGFLGAILLGGIAGLVGAVILINRHSKRLKQRWLKQMKDMEQRLERPSSTSLHTHALLQQTIDRLLTTQTQHRQEIITLKKQVKLLQSQLRVSQFASPSPVPPPLPPSTPPVDAAHLVVAIEPTPEAKSDVEQAIAWLSAHQVNLESYYQPNPSTDAIFNPLAVYLGDRFPILAPLYKQMKRDVATGRQFRFNLKDKTQEEIAVCTQFCKKLSDLSLLSAYKYSKTEKTIQATLQTHIDVIKFFHGSWFERFVYCKITQLLNLKKLKYECLINPKVTFANGNRFELDLFFLIEQQPLWIECKTGKDYDSYLERYSTHRKILGVPKPRSLLVILDIPASQTVPRTHLWEITVASRDSFLQLINTALETPDTLDLQADRSPASPSVKKNRDLATGHSLQSLSTPISSTPISSKGYSLPDSALSASALSSSTSPHSLSLPPSPEAKLIASLNKTDLHPVPEHRAIILQTLIQTVQAAPQPLNFKQLKDALAESTQISKNKVQSVLKAIYRSHYLLSSNGQPVGSYTEPVFSLRSVDLTEIESQCLERYAAVALNNDPNYFDQPQNVEGFERVVGSLPPDVRTLDRLKHEQQPASLQLEEGSEALED